nr:tyrosine-type recombinase/integrase [uncultured Psychroserpens sp.]
MTILTLLDEYCNESKHLRGLSRNSIKRYQNTIGFFIRYTKIQHPEDITKQIVFSFFMYGRKDRKWSTSTVHAYYMSLKVFFTWLHNRKLVKEIFTEDIKLPVIERSLPKALSEDDTYRLLSETYNYPWRSEFERIRNYAIISTYIFTGVRRTELLNLTEKDLNFQQAVLRVNKGKWNKDRIVPMNTILMNTLKDCLHEKQKKKYKSPYVFCSNRRDESLTAGGLKKIMEKLKDSTGLKIGNHILRHTFAVLMLQGGCDIVSLSKMLGHGDVKVTMNYLLLTVDHLKSQMTKHPLSDSQDDVFEGGAINHHQGQQYSSHGFQRPQKHSVFRQNQFSQAEHPIWNSQPSGHSISHYGGRKYGKR